MASANGGSDAPPPPLPLSRECIPLFYEGITLVLSRWTALQMAVENEWGGRDSRNKSETLASDVFTWFTQSKEPLYIDDLECILEECLLLSFNTEAEDGSVEEVAEELMIMHEDFLRGNYEAVDKLRKSSAGPSSVSQSTRFSFIGRSVNKVSHTLARIAFESNISCNLRDAIPMVVNEDEDESSDEEEPNMDVDELEPRLNLQPSESSVEHQKPRETVDADGWCVVPSRRNRGKKH
ncbi:hypothetical protein Sjap_013836 [Stephania japonica]|uniref:Pre-rRNA-processing protein TSR2 homolog n=1 Tax=Stephania japonica TaxID=461633 RepID=A0AAP0IYM0_9MAGN